MTSLYTGPFLFSGAVGFLIAYAAGGTNATGMGGPSLLATTFARLFRRDRRMQAIVMVY